ncbi:DUF2065 domain-containing protein [Thermodesulfobacteriota bacterium]
MSQVKMEFFLCVIGMVFVIEGLPYFGFPDRMKELMAVLHEQDDSTLRIMGGILIAAGVVIIFFARKGLNY